MKKFLPVLFSFMLMASSTTFICAQTNDPNPFAPPPPPNEGDVQDVPPTPVETPFDGGLAILLATGIGYGAVRMRNNRKG